ncbi:hypothetical protein MIND_00370700 [Mycena indigotica]|uniref:Uncharacterized protein n=1 Tax=Mycena indigotica TaxID=2126181 RepID=A0A8H6T319_9AGAR|nr:uncharacterized protein MIND_00370700 [Mycena indigotica]KAF7309979.1 hypothetical protein MIND_00370700 [Mycena indigotica]
MAWTALCIVLFTFFLTPLSLAQITVSAPVSPNTCSIRALNWANGTPPFSLQVSFPKFIASVAGTAAPEHLGSANTPPVSWSIDWPPGSSVVFQVVDATGASGTSPAFNILSSSTGSVCSQGQGANTEGIPPPDGSTGGESGSPPPTNTTSTGKGGSGSNGNNSTSGTTSILSNGSGPDSGGRGNSKSSSVTPSTTSTTTTTTTSSAPETDSFNRLPVSINTGPSSVDTNAQSTLAISSDRTFGASLSVVGILPSSSNVSTSSSNDNAEDSSSKKDGLMPGALIGGIAAAGVLFFIGVFLLLQRCRRRRRRARETILYPFEGMDSASNSTREMRGRSGYPASTFSSWGNHGDLTSEGHERTLSPTSDGHHTFNTVHEQQFSPVDASEQSYADYQQSQPPPISIESRLGYNAPTTSPAINVIPASPSQGSRHGHGTSSSIDLGTGRQAPSEPGSPSAANQRFRGPIPKSMIDAYRAGLVGPQGANPYAGYSDVPPPTTTAQVQFIKADDPIPSSIGRAPSYKTLASAFMDQRQADADALAQTSNHSSTRILPPPSGPLIVNYPPPYTST